MERAGIRTGSLCFTSDRSNHQTMDSSHYAGITIEDLGLASLDLLVTSASEFLPESFGWISAPLNAVVAELLTKLMHKRTISSGHSDVTSSL